jgi:CheY-like chemotaxis protein
MLNLLANAVKYNREGGSVTVFYHLDLPDHLSIWVSDTGPGIAPEDRERMFLPFDRLDADRGGVEGTGLGLALTKVLVEAMHGTIGVESEVGRGSSFWVSLPRTEAPDPRHDHEAPSGEFAPLSLRGRTVLYIEDNPSNHTLMERLLVDRLDMRLLTAIQGRMGLDLAREHSPHLIVLDAHLPDTSGQEVLSRLRADPVTRETPVIVMSADGSPGQMRRMLAAGANAFLTKPLDVKLFLEAVAEALAPRDLARDRE